MKKRIALLGATGSIGKNTLDVLREGRDSFEPVLLSSHSKEEELLELGKEFPLTVLAFSGKKSGGGRIAYWGEEGLLEAITRQKPDLVVNGISGAAGLLPSIAALEAGADLALANKETIVMAGELVLDTAQKKGLKVLPVDSEHSAIFNLINAHGKDSLDAILLTASGGPFRNKSREELVRVKAEAALAHPTWNMGQKITIDSATLANKGLEVIEAARLFHAKPEQIRVVVHPESIVHSMIRLRDGAVYAQLSRPDMRLPIHNALYWPDCVPYSFGELRFENLALHFEKPDTEKFPMLSLAYEALRQGGNYPAVYNAANEEAVAAFLKEKIGFQDIPAITKKVLQDDWQEGDNTLNSILDADKRARKLAGRHITELLNAHT